MYLIYIGSPTIFGEINSSTFKIAISLGFHVMMGLFVAPHVHVEKGTPSYEMIKGGIITLALLILYLVYLVNTR
ncbi:hypothetical protein DOZ58_11645 [Acetobacterium sp. KB-1]|jgi:hypothetical protein|nr:hypothetical protein DOZ58_11645 [Acetobacterium sp. KB-1]